MGEDEAFLAVVRAHPADDMPRLVYADWLDERGDPRGDFLRLESQLRRIPEADPSYRGLQQQLGAVGQSLDRGWVAAVCRVPIEFAGVAMTSATWVTPLSPWGVTAGGVTDIGGYRESNEDLMVFDPARPIAVVLDGMGGRPAGERSASAGGHALRLALAGGPAAGESIEAHVGRSLRAASDAVHALGSDPDLRGAGAVAVLAVLHRGRVFVSWAGDAMAYRVFGDAVEPLTWKHDFRTLVCRRTGMSEEEARQQLWRNVLVHYLGAELPDPVEVPSFTPGPRDRLVLATDGVHGLIEPPDLLAACRRHPGALACAEHLVSCALGRGSRDNATCVVIAFDGPPVGESEAGTEGA